MPKWQSVARAALILLVLASTVPLGAQTASARERAVEAMQHDRMSDAVPLLRVALSEQPTDVEALRMLAVALEQSGDGAEAQRVLTNGIESTALTNADRARLAFDLAAVLARAGDEAGAEALYTRAIGFDGALAAAYLNRANTRVSQVSYEAAIDDYELYLALRPTARQRPQIEQMIAMLNDAIIAERVRQEEEERLAREEAERRAAEEEEQRIAEEQARREAEAARAEAQRVAEERRQQMLSSVLESLGTAGEETRAFELQNEDIRTYDEEIDILD